MTRKERIERMLHELRYEIQVGMMQGDIDETLRFDWVVPVSKGVPGGVVWCRFETRPMHRQTAFGLGAPEEHQKLTFLNAYWRHWDKFLTINPSMG